MQQILYTIQTYKQFPGRCADSTTQPLTPPRFDLSPACVANQHKSYMLTQHFVCLAVIHAQSILHGD